MKKAILLLISSFLFGCRDIESCTSNSEQPFMNVSFFDFETKTVKKSGFRISGTGAADLFELEDDSLSANLELNPQDTSIIFVFDTDTLDYTLRVRYDASYSIFDPKCDPSLLFTGLDTLSSTFDSTAIIGTVTDRQLTTNIEVYF